MNIGNLSLGLFLVLFAITEFGWIVISNVALGVFAFVAGILVLLAELEVFPRKRA